MNLVILRGIVTRQPESRELGSGTELVTYELTVREPGRSAETVPVVCFDPPQATKAIAAGTSVVVLGRVRRRFFRAGGSTASRTEVVAASVVPATRQAQVRRLVERARATLDAPPPLNP